MDRRLINEPASSWLVVSLLMLGGCIGGVSVAAAFAFIIHLLGD